MDAIERAIRSAFEKGDADDKAFRERVYRKAFAALDRGIQANPNLTVESAIRRRKALQAKITEIESEFIPAGPALEEAIEPGIAAEREPAIDVGPARDMGDAPEPAIDGPATLLDVPAVGLDERHHEPSMDGPGHAHGSETAAGSLATAMRLEASDRKERKRSRPFALAFIVVTILALLGMGGWWAYQTGLFLSPAERDTSVPNPPTVVEGEDFIPEEEEPVVLSGEADPQRNWISVFTPADTSQLSAPAGATAEAMQDESGSFLRLRSGPDGAAIVFDIGQGVLEQIAGKVATFDIVARAEEGNETQMAVACNFGELGDCGRKRYAVGYERGDYLFEVTFAATAPGAGGTIAINSDFANQGKAVDIYEIKVSVAP